MLLHVTREAFLFVSACMLTYSYRYAAAGRLRALLLAPVRLGRPALPLLDRIYFFVTLPAGDAVGRPRAPRLPRRHRLLPALLPARHHAVLRAVPAAARPPAPDRGHHVALLLAERGLQVPWSQPDALGVLPPGMQGFWATREVTSYQFYLLAGMVVALHLDEFHDWLFGHVRLVLACTVAGGVLAEGWFVLAAATPSWLGSSSDPFQPIVIPFNIGPSPASTWSGWTWSTAAARDRLGP